LKKRFLEAGIRKYQSFVADLTKPLPGFDELREPFDLLLMDAPCSGSGTWSRNPEELYFFDIERIAYFRGLQESIFSNVISKLRSDGIFIYITCSVFSEENEGMVKFIREKYHLELLESTMIRGYVDKANTMFVARFRA
jgi:16S rRNA (cytosine967-C5)-methyltransferase